MRFELMLPHRIRTAIEKNWPVVLPLGVLEYHGEHLAVGLDTLAVVKTLDILEREMDIVILPPFYYGASQLCCRPPEGKRSLHVGAQVLFSVRSGDVRLGCCASAFATFISSFITRPRISPLACRPTLLSSSQRGRQSSHFLEKERGEGWWGKAEMADYYARQKGGNDPFNWIKAHPLMTDETIRELSLRSCRGGRDFADAGHLPEAVDMERLSAETWYTRDVAGASIELGIMGRDLVLAHMRKVLGPGA